MAKAAGNSDSLDLRQARLPSTLPNGRRSRFSTRGIHRGPRRDTKTDRIPLSTGREAVAEEADSRETRHWIPAIGARGLRTIILCILCIHVKNLFALGAETKCRNLNGVTSCPWWISFSPSCFLRGPSFVCLGRPSCVFVDNSFYPVAFSAKPGCYRQEPPGTPIPQPR